MIRDIFIHGYGIEGKAALPYFQKKHPEATLTLIDQNHHVIDGVKSLDEQEALDFLKRHEQFDTSLYIRSPGVPPTNSIIQFLDENNIQHETALSYWLRHDAPERIITVTGSKGKSTTTALIAHILKQAGHEAFMAGNVGITPFDKEFSNQAIAIIEASSFQLFDCHYMSNVLIVTSMYDTHTDWHGTMEDYCEAKLRPASLNQNCTCLLSELTKPFTKTQLKNKTHWIEQEIETLTLPNTIPDAFKNNPLALNLKTALLAIKLSGFTNFDTLLEKIPTYLETFTGLDHRLETISTAMGREWIDDSLATIPEASILALQQFPDKTVHLLLGGKDRGQSYKSFFDFVGDTPLIHVHASGPAKDVMSPLNGQNFYSYDTFEAAIAGAYQTSKEGDFILFSPGAPSEPPYYYYHVRSKLFKEFAQNLEQSKKHA